MTNAPQRETPAGTEVKRLSLGKRLLVIPFALLARLWLRTLRMPCLDEERNDLSNVSEATTIVLWHNRVGVSAEYARRYRPKRSIHCLVSGSRDGAWLETFFRAVGLQVVRGSRKRRGSQAIRDLAREMKKGHDVGVTPDGSRGPCYKVKPGALALAKIAKSPVLLLSFEFSSAWRLNSWDGFYLPRPFSRVLVRGKLISSELLQKKNSDEAVAFVECELMKLTKDTVASPARVETEEQTKEPPVSRKRHRL